MGHQRTSRSIARRSGASRLFAVVAAGVLTMAITLVASGTSLVSEAGQIQADDAASERQQVEHDPRAVTQSSGIAPAPGEGLNDYHFLEQSTILAKSSAYGSEFEDNIPRTRVAGTREALRPPDEGLTSHQFLEQNTILAKSTAYNSAPYIGSRHPVTGLPIWLTNLDAAPEQDAGVSDYEFLEQNTTNAKSTAHDEEQAEAPHNGGKESPGR